MEYETEKQPGMWDRLKDSPRTVSALIIILVVAAAIYAFSGDNTPEQGEEEAQETAQEQTEASPAVAGSESESTIATPQPVNQQTLVQQRDTLPAATTNEEGYVEAAQAGDGATHLARRAATRWLSENTPNYTVTNEHRIFIEDYIQKKLGSPWLEVGESHTISYELMEEAVAAAGELTPAQLNNLSQYTYVLS